jgi:hypothetical protein
LEPTYEAEAAFKWGYLDYGFKINIVNKVNEHGRLYLNFTDDWGYNSETCKIISGFNEHADRNVTCTLLDGLNSYRIENFKSIGPE